MGWSLLVEENRDTSGLALLVPWGRRGNKPRASFSSSFSSTTFARSQIYQNWPSIPQLDLLFSFLYWSFLYLLNKWTKDKSEENRGGGGCQLGRVMEEEGQWKRLGQGPSPLWVPPVPQS